MLSINRNCTHSWFRMRSISWNYPSNSSWRVSINCSCLNNRLGNFNQMEHVWTIGPGGGLFIWIVWTIELDAFQLGGHSIAILNYKEPIGLLSTVIPGTRYVVYTCGLRIIRRKWNESMVFHPTARMILYSYEEVQKWSHRRAKRVHFWTFFFFLHNSRPELLVVSINWMHCWVDDIYTIRIRTYGYE